MSESEERRLLRRIGQWDMLEHHADGRYWTHEIDALLARQSTGWVAIQDNCERVLRLSRAHGWRVEEVLTEPAAPQPLTADPETAPSNEGVGPGEVAVAADSPSEKHSEGATPRTDAFSNPSTYGEADTFVAVDDYNSLLESHDQLERELAEVCDHRDSYRRAYLDEMRKEPVSATAPLRTGLPDAWLEIDHNGLVLCACVEKDLTSPFKWVPLYRAAPDNRSADKGQG